jgi:hypothetical protein
LRKKIRARIGHELCGRFGRKVTGHNVDGRLSEQGRWFGFDGINFEEDCVPAALQLDGLCAGVFAAFRTKTVAGKQTSAAQSHDGTKAEHRVPSEFLILSDYREQRQQETGHKVFGADAGES